VRLHVDRRKTFVIWISQEPASEGDPRGIVLQGRLEEVDTGFELRFRSADQLISQIEQCLTREGNIE
jgi:hypothetical protein